MMQKLCVKFSTCEVGSPAKFQPNKCHNNKDWHHHSPTILKEILSIYSGCKRYVTGICICMATVVQARKATPPLCAPFPLPLPQRTLTQVFLLSCTVQCRQRSIWVGRQQPVPANQVGEWLRSESLAVYLLPTQ